VFSQQSLGTAGGCLNPFLLLQRSERQVGTLLGSVCSLSLRLMNIGLAGVSQTGEEATVLDGSLSYARELRPVTAPGGLS